jgi:hypothetical protein
MLLRMQTIILIAATAVAWALQPLAQADSGPTMLVGLLLVVAMAVQNCASKVAFAQLPPATAMTGNVTQIVVDATDVMLNAEAQARTGIIGGGALAMGRFKAATHRGRGDLAGDRAADAGFDRSERVSSSVLDTALAGDQDAAVIQPVARRRD